MKFLVASVLVALAVVTSSVALERSRTLLYTLLDDSNYAGGPPPDARVYIDIFLKCVRLNHPSDGLLTSTVWRGLYWRDERLAWNPERWNDTRELRVNEYGIWIPDIALRNAVEAGWRFTYFDSGVVLKSDGRLSFLTQMNFITPCRGDRCRLDLASWTYEGQRLQLELMDNGPESTAGLDVSDYDDQCPWTVGNPSTKINNVKYEGLPGNTYPRAELSFDVSRAT